MALAGGSRGWQPKTFSLPLRESIGRLVSFIGVSQLFTSHPYINMSDWRAQRAEKERVEKEREAAQSAAKAQKLAGLSSGASSSSTTANTVRYQHLPLESQESCSQLAISLALGLRTAF